MREIKFRGFHKKEDGPHIAIIAGKPVRGEWVYGCYTYSKKAERHLIWIQSEDNTEFWHTYPIEVYPSTVGQYTGLHDKNGREIYEGDIIQMPHAAQEGYKVDKNGNIQTPVVWNEKWLRWETGYGMGFGMAYGIEVIGNIYENPELLK